MGFSPSLSGLSLEAKATDLGPCLGLEEGSWSGVHRVSHEGHLLLPQSLRDISNTMAALAGAKIAPVRGLALGPGSLARSPSFGLGLWALGHSQPILPQTFRGEGVAAS